MLFGHKGLATRAPAFQRKPKANKGARVPPGARAKPRFCRGAVARSLLPPQASPRLLAELKPGRRRQHHPDSAGAPARPCFSWQRPFRSGLHRAVLAPAKVLLARAPSTPDTSRWHGQTDGRTRAALGRPGVFSAHATAWGNGTSIAFSILCPASLGPQGGTDRRTRPAAPGTAAGQPSPPGGLGDANRAKPTQAPTTPDGGVPGCRWGGAWGDPSRGCPRGGGGGWRCREGAWGGEPGCSVGTGTGTGTGTGMGPGGRGTFAGLQQDGVGHDVLQLHGAERSGGAGGAGGAAPPPAHHARRGAAPARRRGAVRPPPAATGRLRGCVTAVTSRAAPWRHGLM